MHIRGFTIIELVIVITLLSILSLTALPKFLNLKDDAIEGTLDMTAGAFKEGIIIARSLHEIKGKAGSVTTPDGTTIYFDYSGAPGAFNWPRGATTQPSAVSMGDDSDCTSLFQTLLRPIPPQAVPTPDGDPNKYFLYHGNTHCIWVRAEKPLSAAQILTEDVDLFSYNIETGTVEVFKDQTLCTAGATLNETANGSAIDAICP